MGLWPTGEEGDTVISLEKQSGLPLAFDRERKRKLIFKEGIEQVEPVVRTRGEMEEVLFQPEEPGPQELYYMFRGVALEEDRELLQQHGLRYDITFIKPGRIGREYLKTAGHYHPLKPGTEQTYPEVYEVIYGRAHYLLQKPKDDNYGELERVILIAAKPGDKVLIPPHYGHITINPGEDPLVMSNFVAESCVSVYEPIRQRGGGAYFEIKGEEGTEFLGNTQYYYLPPLRRCPVTTAPRLKLYRGLPLYHVFKEDPAYLSFLVNPENYVNAFEEYLEALLGGTTAP